MKGKKTDPVFMTNFIRKCIELGLDTPDKIVAHAKKVIIGIDDEIKRIEQDKIYRSKLLSVIENFEKPNRVKYEEEKSLDFFKLEDTVACKSICDMIKIKPLTKMEMLTASESNIFFCVKQLISYKILSMTGEGSVSRGERFDEYMTFILREDK
ncbi:MAG TPA: hypothetical protein VII94_00970 [Candidatus Saccharimonadales bacterium]